MGGSAWCFDYSEMEVTFPAPKEKGTLGNLVKPVAEVTKDQAGWLSLEKSSWTTSLYCGHNSNSTRVSMPAYRSCSVRSVETVKESSRKSQCWINPVF